MGIERRAIHTCDRCGREAVVEGVRYMEPNIYRFPMPKGWRELDPFYFLGFGEATLLLTCEPCLLEIATFIRKRKEGGQDVQT